jgi:hypothetical protein
MSIAPNSRLFLLAALLLPIFSAQANLNRGDSPLREIPPGRPADVRAMPLLTRGLFSDWSAIHLPNPRSLESDTEEMESWELDTREGSRGDERYFGSATESEVSKPRMVDFSFGEPCGPLSWWNSSDVQVPAVALTSQVVALPRMNFEWGSLRKPAISSREIASTNAGMAVFPLFLLSMLGLVFRRGQ